MIKNRIEMAVAIPAAAELELGRQEKEDAEAPNEKGGEKTKRGAFPPKG
jgi:hypothetical protein